VETSEALGCWRKTVKMSPIECLVEELPCGSGENLRTNPSRQEVARESEGVKDCGLGEIETAEGNWRIG
jgi:hypothetical protein